MMRNEPRAASFWKISTVALAAALVGVVAIAETQARPSTATTARWIRSTAALTWSAKDGKQDSITASIAHPRNYPSYIDQDAIVTCVYIVGADAVRDGKIPAPGVRRLQHCLRNGRGFRRKEVERVNQERADACGSP